MGGFLVASLGHKQNNTDRFSGNARKPIIGATVIALFLAMSAGISFLGYHYLQLSSEYRMRNMTHMTSITAALDIVNATPILRAKAAEQVAQNVDRARLQTVWCIENLSDLETTFLRQLGGNRALELCADDIIKADRAMALLDQISAPATLHATGERSAFSLGLQLQAVLREMQNDSSRYHPYVTYLEAKIARIVHYGTLLGSLVLLVLLALLSRNLLASWHLNTAQTREIQKFHARFRAAISASRDGFALVDAEGFLVAINDKFCRLMSPDAAQVREGMNIATVFRRSVLAGHFAGVAEGEHAAFIRANIDWMRSDTPGKTFELSNDRHIDVKINRTHAGDNVIVVTDITDFHRNNRKLQEHAQLLVSANREIEYRSLHDPLTDLANRRCLDEVITRNANDKAILLHLDLDRFKQVNDLLGHAAGDFVLKHVACVLRDCVRKEDLVARVGGDEFAILCAPGSSFAEAENIADKILERFREPLSYQGNPCNLGTSIGIAQASKAEDTTEVLLNKADAALYEAKQAGKGQVCLYSPELNARIQKDRDLTKRFQQALEEGEFTPYYQTQHSAMDWRVTGMEVLARWDHPELGVLSPDRFLHIARQLGLENALDAVIFEGALEDLKDIEESGLRIPSMSFNVSAGRILDPNFAATAGQKIPCPRHRFGFEILETVSVEDLGAPLKFAVDNLRDLGFRIEIDDFGSGHASIKSVLELEPHTLKIDRALVSRLDESTQSSRMIRSIIEIGRALDVKITAEGVETHAQAELLRSMGCHSLQGYFFSRPSTLDEVVRSMTRVNAKREKRAK